MARGGASSIIRAVLPIPAALLINDQLEMLVLPAGHVPVDLFYDTDDLDSNGTPLIAFDAGIMTGTPGDTVSARTIGAEFFSADTTPRAGGVARTTRVQGMRIFPVEFDRSVAIKVQAAPATAVVPLTNMNVNRGFWQPGLTVVANDFITLPNGVRAKCTTGGVTGATFPQALGTTLYNATVADGTAVWTIGDPCVGMTLEYRPARGVVGGAGVIGY
jgi:hypothetical protein